MMNKIKYKEWRQLFIDEQNGKKPENMMYHPAPEISISPYLNLKKHTGNTFTHKESTVVHSFIVDAYSLNWLTDYTNQLPHYNIYTLYGAPQLLIDNKAVKSFQVKTSIHNTNFLPDSGDELPVIDLRNKDNMDKIKDSIHKQTNGNPRLWIIPDDDFLWNVGIIRGIRKYFEVDQEGKLSDMNMFTYIPLSELILKESEGQLIPLSNKFLSMMVSGLSQCIWDIRAVSHWQKTHLTELLNIPEILAREGNVLSQKDPIHGSAFFEELSNKILNHLL